MSMILTNLQPSRYGPADQAGAFNETTAAGVVTTALALSRGFLPPTINHTASDGDCDLDVIPNVGRERRIDTVLGNCIGFGSKNAAVVLRRHAG